MKAQKILLTSLIILLSLFSFCFGFLLGTTRAKVVVKEVTRVLEPKESKLVEKRYYNLTGFVKEIDVQNKILILTKDGDEIKLRVLPNEVISFAERHRFVGEEVEGGGRKVTFKDIAVGDYVSIFAEERRDGEIIGTGEPFIHYQPE